MRFLLTTLLLLSSIGTAQELHTFSNGQVADAEKINQNFSILEGRIDGSGGTVNYENHQYAFKAIDIGRNLLTVQNVSYDVVVFDVVSFKDHRVVQVKMPTPKGMKTSQLMTSPLAP